MSAEAAVQTHVEPPLLTMTRTTPTKLWNDSADPAELTAAIGWGAVGATANPVIALAALRADTPRWRERLSALAAHFDGLAPNVIVKIPATSAGIAAIEEVTARGISINATVSFTVPQALAVGEAVERGLRRREAEGHDVTGVGPVCTIMVGRLDDWMKVAADKSGVTLDPGYFEWAGVAVFKRAYQIYTERGYRARLLSAAFRNHMHWSQFVGGGVVISPPFGWQKRPNSSGLHAVPRIDEPVAPEVLKALHQQVGEFRRAYEPDGLEVAEFDTFGATRRTLRQFLTAVADLDALVRDVLLPDPDKERTAS